MSIDAKWMLDVQLKTGRTQSGRAIGKKLKPRIQEALDSFGTQDGKLTECRNCRFVLGEVMFADGCPNCGCKDTDGFGSERKIRKGR